MKNYRVAYAVLMEYKKDMESFGEMGLDVRNISISENDDGTITLRYHEYENDVFDSENGQVYETSYELVKYHADDITGTVNECPKEVLFTGEDIVKIKQYEDYNSSGKYIDTSEPVGDIVKYRPRYKTVDVRTYAETAEIDHGNQLRLTLHDYFAQNDDNDIAMPEYRRIRRPHLSEDIMRAVTDAAINAAEIGDFGEGARAVRRVRALSGIDVLSGKLRAATIHDAAISAGFRRRASKIYRENVTFNEKRKELLGDDYATVRGHGRGYSDITGNNSLINRRLEKAGINGRALTKRDIDIILRNGSIKGINGKNIVLNDDLRFILLEKKRIIGRKEQFQRAAAKGSVSNYVRSSANIAFEDTDASKGIRVARAELLTKKAEAKLAHESVKLGAHGATDATVGALRLANRVKRQSVKRLYMSNMSVATEEEAVKLTEEFKSLDREFKKRNLRFKNGGRKFKRSFDGAIDHPFQSIGRKIRKRKPVKPKLRRRSKILKAVTKPVKVIVEKFNAAQMMILKAAGMMIGGALTMSLIGCLIMGPIMAVSTLFPHSASRNADSDIGDSETIQKYVINDLEAYRIEMISKFMDEYNAGTPYSEPNDGSDEFHPKAVSVDYVYEDKNGSSMSLYQFYKALISIATTATGNEVRDIDFFRMYLEDVAKSIIEHPKAYWAKKSANGDPVPEVGEATNIRHIVKHSYILDDEGNLILDHTENDPTTGRLTYVYKEHKGYPKSLWVCTLRVHLSNCDPKGMFDGVSESVRCSKYRIKGKYSGGLFFGLGPEVQMMEDQKYDDSEHPEEAKVVNGYTLYYVPAERIMEDSGHDTEVSEASDIKYCSTADAYMHIYGKFDYKFNKYNTQYSVTDIKDENYIRWDDFKESNGTTGTADRTNVIGNYKLDNESWIKYLYADLELPGFAFDDDGNFIGEDTGLVGTTSGRLAHGGYEKSYAHYGQSLSEEDKKSLFDQICANNPGMSDKRREWVKFILDVSGKGNTYYSQATRGNFSPYNDGIQSTDCSGFVSSLIYYGLDKSVDGKSVMTTTAGLSGASQKYAKTVQNEENLKPGDYIVGRVGGSQEGRSNHVILYLGELKNGNILVAESGGYPYTFDLNGENTGCVQLTSFKSLAQYRADNPEAGEWRVYRDPLCE